MPKVGQYWVSTELYYTTEHTWARISENGTVRVGIDDFASKTAGQILHVEMPKTGQHVDQMKSFGQIETAKWVGELHAPFSGEIVKINQEVVQNPQLINDDPYGAGWLVEFKVTRLHEEIPRLLHAESAVEWMRQEADAKERTST